MAWVITATALVWLMIPGVGFLYAGLLRRKNALSMMWMAMVLIAVVSFEVRAVDASSPPHLILPRSGSSGASRSHSASPAPMRTSAT